MPVATDHRCIRPDYAKYPKWTIPEAAHYVQRTERTIRAWLQYGFIARADAVGPYRIDADSFLKYLRTGIPQG